ncbi:MAG: TRAP transporter small permease [Pikeienuella sp.]
MSAHGDAEAASAAPGSFLMRRVAAPLSWAGGALATVLILGVFGLMVVAVFRRYVLEKPIQFTDEVSGWVLIAAVMLGMAEAYRRGDHIAIDLITMRLGAVWRVPVGCVSDLAVLGFALVVGISAWEAIAFARGFGMYTTGHIVIETWILQTPLVAGAALLGLVALAKLADRLVAGGGR